MQIKKFNSASMKEYNQNLYYNTIRMMGPISRAKLARITGMSPTSSGRIVSNLIEEGVVREVGETEGNLGRRATLLETVSDGILAIGVDIDAHMICAGLVGVDGRILGQTSIENATSNSEAQELEIVKCCIDRVLESVDDERLERINGIGISLPGVIDWHRGVVCYSPQLGWNNVHLKMMLQNCYPYNVHVENNVKATAQAEGLFGIAQTRNDFVVLQLGSGIGSAVCIDGKVLRGNGNIAGEIGHMLIEPNGLQCDCGRRGCLQSTICILGIEHMTGLAFSEVVRLAKTGNGEYLGLLDGVATKLSQWIANISNIYDPPLVIVCGEMLEQWPELLQLLQERHQRFMWQAGNGRLNICKSKFSREELPIISAAAVVLNEIIGSSARFNEPVIRSN